MKGLLHNIKIIGTMDYQLLPLIKLLITWHDASVSPPLALIWISVTLLQYACGASHFFLWLSIITNKDFKKWRRTLQVSWIWMIQGIRKIYTGCLSVKKNFECNATVIFSGGADCWTSLVNSLRKVGFLKTTSLYCLDKRICHYKRWRTLILIR